MKTIYLGQRQFCEEYMIRFLGESLFFISSEVSFICVLQSWFNRKAGKCFYRIHKHKAQWYDNTWGKILSFIEFNFVRPLYQKERDKKRNSVKSIEQMLGIYN